MIYRRIKNPDTSHVYDLMPRRIEGTCRAHKKRQHSPVRKYDNRTRKERIKVYINVVVKITISMIIKLMRYLPFYSYWIEFNITSRFFWCCCLMGRVEVMGNLKRRCNKFLFVSLFVSRDTEVIIYQTLLTTLFHWNLKINLIHSSCSYSI